MRMGVSQDQTEVFKAHLWVVAAMIAVIFMAGCGGAVNYSPGKTTGKLLVSSPKISTRERLLNDRLEQEAWLAAQLRAADDQSFGLQGTSDVRSFLGVVTKADVNIDPTQAKLYRKHIEVDREKADTELELARLERQIQILNKQRELQNLKDAPSDGSGDKPSSTAAAKSDVPGGADNASGNGSTSGSNGQAGQSGATPVPSSLPNSMLFQDVQQLKEKMDQLLLNPSNTAVANVRVTPIDGFKDRLAYRTAIRNEILENALDDRHDLGGNALLRLSFDATVVPENDSSAWALVEVCVGPKEKGAGECYGALGSSNSAIREPRRDALEQECETAQFQCENGRDQAPWCTGKSSVIAGGLSKPVVSRKQKRGGTLGVSDVCRVKASDEMQYESYVGQYHNFSHSLEKSLNLELSNLLSRSTTVPMDGAGNTALEQAGIFLANLSEIDQQELSRTAVRRAVLTDKISSPFLATIPAVAPAEISIPAVTLDQFTETLRYLVNAAPAKSPFIACKTGDGSKELRCAFNIVVIDYVISKTRDDPEGRQLPLGFVDYRPDYSHRYIKVETKGTARSPDERNWVRRFAQWMNSKTQMFVYAVTPKETTERVSDVASRREVTEFVLQLSALLGNVGGAKAATDYVKANEAIYQALRRQPLVVGFSRGPNADAAHASERLPPTFGWVLGPRYGIANDGRSAQFRHAVSQHSLAALVSFPPWWKEVDVVVKTYWLSEDGKLRLPENWTRYEVVLPATAESLLDAVKGTLRPKVDPPRVPQEVLAGEPASLLISGSDLWRNTVVTLGAQKAERIEVLPDMKGILAHFGPVLPSATQLSTGRLPLIVWTSQGSQEAGSVSVRQSTQTPALSGTIAQLYIVSQSTYEAQLSDVLPKAPVQLEVARAGVGEKAWKAVPFDVDGRRVKFVAPAIEAGKLDSGDQVILSLAIKDNRDGDVRRITLKGTPVLYSEMPRVSFSSKAYTSGTWLPQQVEATFPRNSASAFPGFNASEVPIVVASPADQPFRYQIKGSCKVDEKSKCSFLIDAAEGDVPAFKQYADTDNKPVRALFSVPLLGGGISVVNDGAVTLAK